MDSFKFREGSSELLSSCDNLWELFTQNQIQNAGEMSVGIAAYIKDLRDGVLLAKTKEGKLQVQLVYATNQNNPIGFCITSLSGNHIGEVETLFVLDKYQGNNIGTKLLQRSLEWMEENSVSEQKLVVAAGNERVFSFYQKFGFSPGCTVLFRQ